MSNPIRPQASLATRAHRFKAVAIAVLGATIEASKPRDSSHCMIADSLKLSFPRSFPSVDLATIRYTDREQGVRLTFLTPPNVQDALIKFDQGVTIEPFTFKLQKPILVQPSGGKKKLANGETVPAPSRRREGVTVKGRGNAPILVGGPPLPNGPLATTKGRVRAYGLKQLEP